MVVSSYVYVVGWYGRYSFTRRGAMIGLLVLAWGCAIGIAYGSPHTTVTPLRQTPVLAPVQDDYAGSVAQRVARYAGHVRKAVTVALKPIVAGIRRHRSLTEVWPMDLFSGVGRHRQGTSVALTLARL